MRKGQKRWGAVGVALLLVSAGAFYFRAKSGSHRHETAEEAADDGIGDRRWRGFAAGTPGIAPDVSPDAGAGPGTGPAFGDPAGWVAPTYTARQLESAMDAWRHAILEKNADRVLMLDHAFALYPGRYGPELLKVAQSDADARVRAFSTRVLGKEKNVALGEDFQRLLADASPYVRQNAAWALGELVLQPGGHDALEAAGGDLRRIEETDPSQDVRKAATNALKGLQ
jgi:HEAT repeats